MSALFFPFSKSNGTNLDPEKNSESIDFRAVRYLKTALGILQPLDQEMLPKDAVFAKPLAEQHVKLIRLICLSGTDDACVADELPEQTSPLLPVVALIQYLEEQKNQEYERLHAALEHLAIGYGLIEAINTSDLAEYQALATSAIQSWKTKLELDGFLCVPLGWRHPSSGHTILAYIKKDSDEKEYSIRLIEGGRNQLFGDEQVGERLWQQDAFLERKCKRLSKVSEFLRSTVPYELVHVTNGKPLAACVAGAHKRIFTHAKRVADAPTINVRDALTCTVATLRGLALTLEISKVDTLFRSFQKHLISRYESSFVMSNQKHLMCCMLQDDLEGAAFDPSSSQLMQGLSKLPPHFLPHQAASSQKVLRNGK